MPERAGERATGLSGSMTPERASEVLRNHFNLFDTAAGIGGRDGIVARVDLEAVVKDKGLPADIRGAANYLLENPVAYNALDVASGIGRVDGFIGRSDVEAFGQPPAPWGGAGGVPACTIDPQLMRALSAALLQANLGCPPGMMNLPTSPPRSTNPYGAEGAASGATPRAIQGPPASGTTPRAAEAAASLVREHEGLSSDERKMIDSLQSLGPDDRKGAIRALGPKWERVVAEMLDEGNNPGRYSQEVGGLLAQMAKDAKNDPEAQSQLQRAITAVNRFGGDANDDTIRAMITAMGREAQGTLATLPRSTRSALTDGLKSGWYSAEDKDAVRAINVATASLGEPVF